MRSPRFANRQDAGAVLAEALKKDYGSRSDVLVLALPRGGVPVAAVVARELGAPLDVFLVRKLGVPGHEELAFGAIAEGGTEVLHGDVVRSLGISRRAIAEVAARERLAIDRHDALYRAGRPYEFMPMLGTHMVSDPMTKLRQHERVVEFFQRTLR